jgi:gamma-glutamyltranspeptidase / glutathione hydrolase
MTIYEKAVVASGHRLVSDGAAEILHAGGNAFDAVVAAGFISAVVEPTLTSLGGGGLLVGYSERFGQELFFDFFVDTPGAGRRLPRERLDFAPVTVEFSDSSQKFMVGLGAVAVPGTLKGLVHIHQRLGRMTLAEVVEPAKRAALGHEINGQQGHFLSLLRPILTRSPEGLTLYTTNGVLLQTGDRLVNSDYAAFLELVAGDHGREFYFGEMAATIDGDMERGGGLLSREDLAGYRVHERAPLRFPYRSHELVTAAWPSLGGTLIGRSLALLEQAGPAEGDWDNGERLAMMVDVQRRIDRLRVAGGIDGAGGQLSPIGGNLNGMAVASGASLFSRGTTHISVADRHGNCASMTCSNGEGSGYIAPGSGVMLNNMMGEDDLHPGGFHTDPPGQRVLSMMSPSLLLEDHRVTLVIGSGGSKRIRTALVQVIGQVIDGDRRIDDAVRAPRAHWDGELIQIEPGLPESSVRRLAALAPVRVWSRQDVYFGGVHAVVPGCCGAGDPRRGGAVAEV